MTEENINFLYEKIEKIPEIKEWNLISKYRGNNYLQTVKDRLKSKKEYTGFLVKRRDNREIIALSWIRFKSFYEDKLRTRIDLTRSDAFFYDAYCVPEFRGNKLHYQMMVIRMNFCFKKGFKNGYTVVSHFNKASLKTIKRLNFKKIASKTYFRSGLIKQFIKINRQ